MHIATHKINNDGSVTQTTNLKGGMLIVNKCIVTRMWYCDGQFNVVG